MIVTMGMGANGVLPTSGFGYNSYLVSQGKSHTYLLKDNFKPVAFDFDEDDMEVIFWAIHEQART